MTIDQRLREASRHVHEAADQTVETPRRVASPPGRLRLAATLTVLGTAIAVLIPLMWTPGTADPDRSGVLAPVSPDPTQPSPDQEISEIPADVLAYRSLEGTLLSIGNEPGWLCPAMPWTGYRSVVPDSEIPANLVLSAPGLENISEHRGSSGGPNCHQPVSLVLLGTDSGAAIWPSVTRFPETCATDSCEAIAGNVTPPTTLGFTGSTDHPTINGREALLHGYLNHSSLWFEDPNGVPLYLEASGLTPDEVIALAETVAVDFASSTVSLNGDAPSDLAVVEQGPSVGYWITDYAFGAKFRIADASIAEDGSIWVDTSFGGHSLGRQETPLSVKASFGAGIELVDLGDRQAIWNPEGERYLSYITDTGGYVFISGFKNRDDAVDFALSLK